MCVAFCCRRVACLPACLPARSLLKVPGFLLEFITPIVKVSKSRAVQSFYTLPEYENWKKSIAGGTKGWAIKCAPPPPPLRCYP